MSPRTLPTGAISNCFNHSIWKTRNSLCHPSSYVDDHVTVGDGTKIWHFCHVQAGASIGRNCSLGQNVNVGNNIRIGNGVRIQNNVSVYEGVEIEDNVFCGPSCVFTNVITPRALSGTWRICQNTHQRRRFVRGELYYNLRPYRRSQRNGSRRCRGD